MSQFQIVTVNRRPEVEEARSKLPIIAQEQEIMETINSQVKPLVMVTHSCHVNTPCSGRGGVVRRDRVREDHADPAVPVRGGLRQPRQDRGDGAQEGGGHRHGQEGRRGAQPGVRPGQLPD